VWSVAYSPDGRYVISASNDKTIRIWSVQGGGAVRVLKGHGAGVNSAAYSPDGEFIVSASWDETVRLWPATGNSPVRTLPGPAMAMFSASYSPDGKMIVATAMVDRYILVWRVDDRLGPRILKGHEGLVPSATFSPDGAHILSASWDGTVRIWRDFDSISIADPRVWAATSYCWTVEAYERHLGFSAALAARQRERCLRLTAKHFPAGLGTPAPPPVIIRTEASRGSRPPQRR
jgi:WD40 repeat protein